jgi:collagenase-like PrtC family protease
MREAINTGTDNIIISDSKSLYSAEKSGGDQLIEAIDSIKGFSGKIILDTPDIIYDRYMERILAAVEALPVQDSIQVKVSNMGLLEAIRNSGRIKRNDRYIILGGMLNISNTLSALFYDNSSINIAGWEFSPEIDRFEIGDIISSFRKARGNEYIFSLFGHGYFRVIAARHRIKYGKKQYGLKVPAFLKDRKNYKFRLREDEAKNTNIYNSRKACTLFDLDKVKDAGINDLVIDSIFADIGETAKLVKSYRKAISLLDEDRVGDYKKYAGNLKSNPLFMDYSRGHLLNGVE